MSLRVIRDARELSAGTSLEADLCIAGAGAAGINVAREFVSEDLNVVLLEAGPLGDDDNDAGDGAETASYEGCSIGLPIDVAGSRIREFGGTTNRWGGWCTPMEPSDFLFDGYPPGVGWPIDRTELLPYYEDAHETCSLRRSDYDAETASYVDEPLSLAESDTSLRHVLYRQSPVTGFSDAPDSDFGNKYREILATAEQVTLYTHANVVDIDTDRNGSRVRRFACETVGGPSFSIRAARFVLSMGGLENPRLLLASDSSGRGLGNQSDSVGRYFMQHPHCYTDTYVVLDEADTRFYSWHSPDQYNGGGSEESDRILGAISLDPDLRNRANLPNVAFTLEPVKEGGFVSKIPNNGAAFGFSRVPQSHLDVLKRCLSDGANVYRLYIRAEQRPIRESRVSLQDETDAFGLPRIKVDWRLADGDLRAYQEALDALERAFETADLGGEILRPSRGDEFTLRDLWGAGHHMGTTRMSYDPKEGVVTPECRVYGVDNLYVAGSSVFPTGGYANPTLTIVALAHRLGDHLREELVGGAV